MGIFLVHPEVKAVYGSVKCVDAQTGETVSVFGKPCTFKKRRDTISSISHPAFFAKRSVYEKVGYFFLRYKCAMDLDYFLRVVKFYKPYYLNEVLTIMRGGGFGARNIFRGHRETYRILRSDGMGIIAVVVDLLYRYTVTIASLILQKVGLKRFVFFYREVEGTEVKGQDV